MKASQYEVYYDSAWVELTTVGCPPPTRAPFRKYSDTYETQNARTVGDGAGQVEWFFEVLPFEGWDFLINDVLGGAQSAVVSIKTRYPYSNPITYPAFTAIMHMPEEDSEARSAMVGFHTDVTIKFTNVVAV